MRGHDGHARQGARLGPRGVGDGRRVDGIAAVADRGPPPSRDPRGDAEEARVRSARPGRRPCQARDLRRDLGATVRVRAPGGSVDGPHRAEPGRVRARWARADEPSLRLRGPERRRVKTLIEGGWVVAWNGTRHEVYERGAVVYEGDRVVHAGGPYAGAVDARVSARGKLVSPGFINTHVHTTGNGGDWMLGDMVKNDHRTSNYLAFAAPLKGKLTPPPPETVAALRAYVFLHALKNGSTTIIDVGGLRGDWEGYARLVDDLGVRVYASPPFRDRNTFTDERGRLYYEADTAAGAKQLDEAVAFVKAYDGTAQGRLRGMLNAAQVETCSESLLRAGKAAARDLGVPIHTHAGGNLVEFQRIMDEHRKTPIQFLADIGFLDHRTLIGHGVFTTAHPWTLLSLRRRHPRPRRDRRHGGALSVQVRQDGHDPALVPALPRRRGEVAMGTDTFPDGHGGGAAVGVDPDPRHRPELPGGPVPRRLQCGDARRVPVHRAPRPRPPRAGEQGRHRADQPRPHGDGRLHRSHQGARGRGHGARRRHRDRGWRDAGRGRPRRAGGRVRRSTSRRARPRSATGSTCRAGTGRGATSTRSCRPPSPSTARVRARPDPPPRGRARWAGGRTRSAGRRSSP